MKKILLYWVVIASLISCETKSKLTDDFTNKKKVVEFTIDTTEVKKHLYTLASDTMEGRKPGTEGIEKAAVYIENQFKEIGLKPYITLPNYRQNFRYNHIGMCNIIGVLEGKTKKDEYVIISAHYDHLGMMNPGKGDRIYNGANDDASGVAGVLALASYFKKLDNNERSIIFIAFTGEELGLLGSKYFAKNINPKDFVAGVNLELIGKAFQKGAKTAWLTGFEKSDLGAIIQSNIQGIGYQLIPDPYPKLNLFYRSDNAPLAELGVPSHTFSSTAIDTDPDYHKVTDEAKHLDVYVLTENIKAIAKGLKSIINRTDTPTRIE